MRLATAVVGVLAQDHDLGFIKRTSIEGVKDLPPRRIHGSGGILAPDKGGKMLKIGFFKLVL
jgi:hypothetical protein